MNDLLTLIKNRQSARVTFLNRGWVDWHDWIGFDFLPFSKARTYVRRLKLKNRKEYQEWLLGGQKPKNIPYNPEKEYRHTGWINLRDWLGIDYL